MYTLKIARSFKMGHFKSFKHLAFGDKEQEVPRPRSCKEIYENNR